MRLSSSSLEIAKARISCSLRSANRFTQASLFFYYDPTGTQIRSILNEIYGLVASFKGHEQSWVGIAAIEQENSVGGAPVLQTADPAPVSLLLALFTRHDAR